MLRFLVNTARGVITLSLILAVTIFLFLGLLTVGLFAYLMPFTVLRQKLKGLANKFPQWWTKAFDRIFTLMMDLEIEVNQEALSELSPYEWYLLVSNHQNWIDILVLFHVFNYRIPVLKFFVKRELRYLPLVGWACFILDYPFVYRYTKKFLKKHPEKAGSDLENTRKACEKFKYHPTTIVNFMEGTRFTSSKHQNQQSTYEHLLNPRAGGVAYVLAIMGKTLHKLIDVTIVYEKQNFNFWQFLSSGKNRIKVHVAVSDIDSSWCGDYQEDVVYRKSFQQTIKLFWQEKDALMMKMKREFEDEKNIKACHKAK